MLQSVMNKLSSPAGWVAGFAQFVVFRMLETRDVAGLRGLIQPGS